MYYRHFGLNGPPFSLTPDTERFYPGAGRGEILAAMRHALREGAGILKLTGEVGSGKTMLARMLMEQLSKQAEIVYLANPSLERDDIHHAIALELGLDPAPGLPRVRLLDRIQQRLIEIHREGRFTVVFIEEAQGMPVASLEEARYLSNLETSSSRMLQIVLIGQPELDELLTKRELRQLDDRIAHGFTLPPLSSSEVHDYLAFRLRCAGHASGELFTEGACRLLHRASEGRLRRLNILADKSLLAAYASSASRVLPAHVRRARRDREGKRSSAIFTPFRMIAASLGASSVAGLLLFGLLSPGISIGKAVPDLSGYATSGSSRVNGEKVKEVSRTTQQALDATRPSFSVKALIEKRLAAVRELSYSGDHRYVIQLSTTHDRNRAALARFLDALPESLYERLYIYPVQIGDHERYSVILGQYASLREAREVLEKLPASLKRDHPYIRPLSAIQIEAGLAQGGSRS